MASRPQNIGIKAIEIYFPSQVRLSPGDISKVLLSPWEILLIRT